MGRLSRAAIVLLHSPLVGPASWAPVAQRLRAQGERVYVPPLEEAEELDTPYWQQHVAAIRRALAALPADEPLHLVAHSGAGPLLPAIGAALPQPVRCYLFVDAGIPRDGASRLDLIAEEAPEWIDTLRAHLAAGGLFPTWDEATLRPLLPKAAPRQALLAELRPRPRAFFEEPLPVFVGWPDAPCAYLQLSPAYDVPARQAAARGWPLIRLAAGHFHLMVAPDEVAAQIRVLLQ